MQTKIYKNWLSKIYECGLSNEQACGMAMLLAWNLTSQKKDSPSYDPDIYWNFVDKSDYELISTNSFMLEDFLDFVPLLRLAGDLLRTQMPVNRLDSENQVAELLNLDWQNSPEFEKEETAGKDNLYFRHRFDLLWCQKIGESLRAEIRNPVHAFVFVDYLTHGFQKFDPEGYSRILHSLCSRLSPFAAIFSSRHFVIERNGLEGHEPFQIALLGIMANIDPKLGEQLWNLQRVMFYKQPGGTPINLEKQYIPLASFIEFSLPLITDFIDAHRRTFMDVGRLVSTDYLYKSFYLDPFDHLCHILEDRYGFPSTAIGDDKSGSILINVAYFYTTSCLKIRNLSNRISTLPTLRMLDEAGLIWSREIPPSQQLRDEAVLCFDVMLSWRFGAGWALFLETEHGYIQRFYVGDTSEYSEVDNLFSEICIAYSPVRCTVAFWSHRQAGTQNVIEEVVFLNLDKDEFSRVEVFQGVSDYDFGRGLGKYIGQSEDSHLVEAYFPKLRDQFFREISYEVSTSKQDELISLFPPASNWNFVNRLQTIATTDESVTYVDVEDVKHDDIKTSLWLLIDYKKPQIAEGNLEFKSSKILCEYDCKNKTRKFLLIKMFELSMGAGSCLYHSGELNEPASELPSEGNVGYKAWEIACELNPSMNL